MARQSVGQVDLCPDGVGQVRNHQYVLNVGVEHPLDIGGGDLRRKRNGVHQKLADSSRALAFTVLLLLSVIISCWKRHLGC